MHDIRSSLIRGEHRSTLASKAQTGTQKSPRGGGLAAVRIHREESRKCNQRREDRHLNVADRAELRFQRRKYDVEVINVSSQGTMIAAELTPHIGAKVQIRFEGCNETQCVVRWVRDGRIGLEFSAETLIIAKSDVKNMIIGGRRNGEQETFVSQKAERPPRHSFIIRGRLHWPADSTPVTVRNISSDGAMLEGESDVAAGTGVVLEIPGASAAPAMVMWCRSGQIGVRFDAPFDLPRLADPNVGLTSPPMLKPEYLKTEMDPDSPWAARWDRLSPEDLAG